MAENKTLTQQELDITAMTLQEKLKQADIFIKSGFLPEEINKPEQVVVIMEVAQSLRIPAIYALNSIHVIKGRPTMSAELMRALIFRSYPNATFEVIKHTDKVCRIRAGRPDGKAQEFEFTLEMAKRAGLLNKMSWKQYPEALLLARCTSLVARTLFPDILMGVIYTPEELGAEVSDAGEVIRESFPPAGTPEPESQETPDQESTTQAEKETEPEDDTPPDSKYLQLQRRIGEFANDKYIKSADATRIMRKAAEIKKDKGYDEANRYFEDQITELEIKTQTGGDNDNHE